MVKLSDEVKNELLAGHANDKAPGSSFDRLVDKIVVEVEKCLKSDAWHG